VVNEDGLDMLNVKIMDTGSSTACRWKLTDRVPEKNWSYCVKDYFKEF